MAQRVEHSDVQIATGWGIREYIREVNIRLRWLAQAININHDDQWEDLRFPASGINPTGPTSPATVDTTYGGLLFAGVTTNNMIAFQVQMPHGWKEGSTIKPHVHWQKTTSASGNVRWLLSYRHAALGSVMDNSWSTLAAYTPVQTDTNTAGQHLLTPLGDITMTGKKVSHMMLCLLERTPADANDTYNNADARLLEIDFHYQVDANGSRALYEKV